MVRMLMSLLPMAAAFQVMETHPHVDFDGLKVSLQSLAANSAKAGKIDQGTIDAVNGFLNTISNDLLTALEADRNHSQTILDDAVDDVTNCDTVREAWFDGSWSTWNSNVTDKFNTHRDCRSEEDSEYHNFTVHCKTMHDRVCRWNVCALPAGGFHGGDTDAVDTYMNCVDNFFDSNRADYYDERTNCIDATNIHAAQVVVCDGEQGEFEDEYCDREEKVQYKCQQYNICRRDEETKYLSIKADTIDLEEIFQSQFVALHHLLCYGNQILANSTDLSGCDAVSNDCAADYTNCPQITYAVPDAFIECTEPRAGNYPCTADFEAEFYADLATSYPNSPLDDCHTCTDMATLSNEYGGGRLDRYAVVAPGGA